MTILTSIIAMLSATLLVIFVPRIYGSWLHFKEYVEEGDLERLIDLQSLHNEWVIRNLCMALLTMSFVAAMKYLPELENYSQTAAATAVYSVITFIFAFVESIMAQKISGYTATTLQPVKVCRDEHRH